MVASATETSRANTDDARVVAFLEHDAFGPTRRIDTHAAHIFLSSDRAWKLKRPVNLGFLDFSTVEKRRMALQAELDLNRRTAPDLYLALHRITHADDDGLAVDGDGYILDWILEMRRFPDDALLTHIAQSGQLDDPLLIRLADVVHALHRDADIVAGEDGCSRLRTVVDGNADRLERLAEILPAERTDPLIRAHRDALQQHRALLDLRAAAGRIRLGHGDLHLGNVAVIEGEPVPFDCLEFDEALASTDVLYDLAFLLMDLWHLDLRNEANIIFNHYLDRSAADEHGTLLMPFFMSLRATIRAHVTATRMVEGDAEARADALAYLDLAARLLLPAPPHLIAVGGLSGTGKTSLARMLGGLVGRAPGARILRSDILRKRIAGVAPETKLPRSQYTKRAGDRSYQKLRAQASRHLADGDSVIADATFARVEERLAMVHVALRAHVPFAGLWLEVPIETRARRVRGRHSDASDADEAVARAQAEVEIGDDEPWHILPVDDAPDVVAACARAMLHSALT